MKKMVISVAVVVDQDVAVDALISRLAEVGEVSLFYSESVELVSDTPVNPVDNVWFYASDDIYNSGRLGGEGNRDGLPLTDEQLARLQACAVATGIHIEYPAPEKYGMPEAMQNDHFAAATIGEHGFRCIPEGLLVDGDDTGDDSAQSIWIQLAITAEDLKSVIGDVVYDPNACFDE